MHAAMQLLPAARSGAAVLCALAAALALAAFALLYWPAGAQAVPPDAQPGMAGNPPNADFDNDRLPVRLRSDEENTTVWRAAAPSPA